MNHYLAQIRAFSRDIRLFLVTPALIGLTVFGGIYTVLFNLFLVRLGYESEFIGTVNATGQLALAVFALPASALGSRLGLRRIMIIGTVLAFLGHTLPILAEFVPDAWRATWILVTYLGGGLGLALYFVNSSPWVMSVAKPSERGHVFSIQAALWPLAGFVGSLIGGALPSLVSWLLSVPLTSPIPYRYPLLFAASLLLISVITTIATSAEQKPVIAQVQIQSGSGPLILVLMIGLFGILRGAGEGAARTFFNLYMDRQLGVSASQIGLFLALGQLLSVPAALYTPIFAARWGHERAILLGTLGTGLALLPFALIPQWTVVGVSFMAMLTLVSVGRPAFMIYSQELVPATWQGMMSATTTMSIGISWALIAFGGGYLIKLYGYRPLFLLGAGLTMLGSLVFWSYFRVPRGEFVRNGL